MQTILKKLAVENFKGCKKADYEFSNMTIISGANATGKTTINDAFCWLLFNKDSQGNEKFNIRPLNNDGTRIDNVEIKVAAVLEIDGKEIELSKVQKQKWVKKRGSATQTLQGNENLYEIDGYPKSEKEYKERVADIIEEELFKMITSPTYFVSLGWKEQRKILMRFVNEITDLELALGNPEFVGLVEEIRKAPSLEDIQKKYAKALSEWKKKQAELPVRIDEAERQKIDIDVAELELAKKDILEQISENQAKQDDVSKQLEEYQKLSDGIFEIKFEMNDMNRKANQENDAKRKELERQKYDLDRQFVSIQSSIRNKKKQIESQENSLKVLQDDLTKARQEWTSLSKMEFDENSLICSMCGQEYPSDKANEIIQEFEARKQKEISNVTKKGNAINENLKLQKSLIETGKSDLDSLLKQEKEIQNKLEDVKSEYEKLPSTIDVTGTEDYKKLEKELAEKEKALLESNDKNAVKNQLRMEREQLHYSLNEVEKELSKSSLNIQLDERIEELQVEQREVSQKVADQEKMIYLLEQFIRYKMNKISEIINSKFDGICFKLFENQINGGLKECCECTANGVPYSSLNNGHRIAAGLKIIKALQELYGVSAPIFVDNAEAISNGNLPQMSNQMILLAVGNDKKLRIEV